MGYSFGLLCGLFLASVHSLAVGMLFCVFSCFLLQWFCMGLIWTLCHGSCFIWNSFLWRFREGGMGQMTLPRSPSWLARALYLLVRFILSCLPAASAASLVCSSQAWSHSSVPAPRERPWSPSPEDNGAVLSPGPQTFAGMLLYLVVTGASRTLPAFFKEKCCSQNALVPSLLIVSGVIVFGVLFSSRSDTLLCFLSHMLLCEGLGLCLGPTLWHVGFVTCFCHQYYLWGVIFLV